jgi:threonine/homoserine/homoserine lactone efflux protein
MSTATLTKQISESKTRVGSRVIGAYYLLTVLTGVFVLVFHGRFAFTVDLLLGTFYLVVTAFLYGRSASRNKMTGSGD